jgi:putative ABC transport system substrate-binding protein
MKRRELITMLGGAAIALPFGANTQQLGKPPIIGFLDVSKRDGWGGYFVVFVQRLRELGWIEGRTVIVERRQAEGRAERYSEIAAEFVRLNAAIIVTGGIAVRATMQTTSVIPIVFAVANDPVGAGLVASLSRPGGNVIGLSLQAPDIIGKRLEFLLEAVHGLRHLAIVGNVSYPSTTAEMQEIQAAASKLGVTAVLVEIRRLEDIAPAFESLKGRTQAAFVCNDALVNANHVSIMPWRSTRGCRRFMRKPFTSEPAVSFPMPRTIMPCFDGPPSWSTRFCAGRSQPISR